jgi:hypothetical protein
MVPAIRVFGPVPSPRIDTTRPLGENGCGMQTTDQFKTLRSRRTGRFRRPVNTMTLRSAAKTLLTLTIGLPMVQAVLIWVRGLLASMGDDAGAEIIRHVGTACQVVWSISLIGLVVVLAIIVLNERPPSQHE